MIVLLWLQFQIRKWGWWNSAKSRNLYCAELRCHPSVWPLNTTHTDCNFADCENALFPLLLIKKKTNILCIHEAHVDWKNWSKDGQFITSWTRGAVMSPPKFKKAELRGEGVIVWRLTAVYLGLLEWKWGKKSNKYLVCGK